jgi:outer membrane immunogenic protein
MIRLSAGTVAVAFAALTTPTIAAKAAPVVTPPIYNWTGCYFGGNVGWTSAHTSGTLTADDGDPPSSFGLGAGNTPFFIGGGQVGCDYQSGQFVFGIEGDADWRGLSRTGYLLPGAAAISNADSGNFSLTSKWQASLRGRSGYAVDHTLWYATGGIAWTGVSLGAKLDIENESAPATGPYDLARVSKTAVGWTLGGGVDYAVREDVTLGLEGRYNRYGSHHFDTWAVSDPAAFPATGDLNVNSSEIIGKVNFRFNSNSQSTEPPPMRRNQ